MAVNCGLPRPERNVTVNLDGMTEKSGIAGPMSPTEVSATYALVDKCRPCDGSDERVGEMVAHLWSVGFVF